jgi:uncharacterized protein YdhG (YjbR/CyaY superfamily)
MNATTKTAKRTETATEAGFSADEKAAMRERARETKAEAKRGADREAGLADLRAKIADMDETDRALAERFHAIVTATAPDLEPKTWYGMPAYAKDGKLICFFQPAAKFKGRYATFGFQEDAHLDDGNMWPTSWALTKLTKADEERIAALVKKAVS